MSTQPRSRASRALPESTRASASRPQRELDTPPPDAPRRTWVSIVLVLGGVLLVALIYRWTASNDPLPAPPSASAAASSAVDGRCVAVSSLEGFVVGTHGQLATPEPQAPDLDTDTQPDRDDLLAPFAVVLGRATSFADGFALGMLGEAKEGSSAFVVTLSADGTTGKTIKLLRSRADLDPPAVAAVPGDSSVFAATLEPNASGRAIRMARVRGEEIAWGAEIPEGNDESLALDLAVNERRGVVVWDALDGDRSIIHLAGFALDDFGKLSSSRRATTKEQDADSPRVVATDKGFFLVYLVHGGEIQRDNRSGPPPVSAQPTASASATPSAKPQASAKPSKTKKKPAEEKNDSVDIDETKGGESISDSWIEAVPLDESGAQSSDAIRVTPQGVTVISFDVAPGPNGTLLVAYRDDDAPMGGAGGIIRMANVHPGGIGATYESDEPLPSDGVPALLDGWLGVPTLAGSDMLARLGADGMPAESLVREGSLGRGEPIAANADRMLLTEPMGAAMRLRVVQCRPTPTPAAEPAPSTP